jgi:hypothetical protein
MKVRTASLQYKSRELGRLAITLPLAVAIMVIAVIAFSPSPAWAVDRILPCLELLAVCKANSPSSRAAKCNTIYEYASKSGLWASPEALAALGSPPKPVAQLFCTN